MQVYEGDDVATELNLLNANIETVVPAVYNSSPIPNITRRYPKPAQQPAQPGPSMAMPGLPPEMMGAPPMPGMLPPEMPAEPPEDLPTICATILERCLTAQMDQYDFDGTAQGAVRSGEVTGRGILRERYVPQVGTVADPLLGDEHDAVINEETYEELIPYDKFVRGPGRTFQQCQWVAFEHDYTKEEVAQLIEPDEPELPEEPVPQEPQIDPLMMFPEEAEAAYAEADAANSQARIQYQAQLQSVLMAHEAAKTKAAEIMDHLFPRPGSALSGDDKDEKTHKGVYATVTVYEMWDRKKRQIIFLTERWKDDPLKVQEDPLGLQDFFPVVEPYQPGNRVGSQKPVVHYHQHKRLYEEANRIVRKIRELMKSMKVVYVGAPQLAPIVEQLLAAKNGEVVPVPPGLAGDLFVTGSQTKVADLLHPLPFNEAIVALRECYTDLEQVIAMLDRVTGVSDIQRGLSDPNETLGAQQLKASWGSQRIDQKRKAAARMCRDVLRLKAEIICNHFSPETMSALSEIDVTPEMLAFLRDRALMMYRIDIETDSTTRGDVARDLEQINQFFAMTGQFIQALASLVQVVPEAKAPMFEVFAGASKKFRLGRNGEEAIDKMIDQMRAAASAEAMQQAAMAARGIRMVPGPDGQPVPMQIGPPQAQPQPDGGMPGMAQSNPMPNGMLQ